MVLLTALAIPAFGQVGHRPRLQAAVRQNWRTGYLGLFRLDLENGSGGQRWILGTGEALERTVPVQNPAGDHGLPVQFQIDSA